MAATTSNVNPRRTGFDFAALAASAGRQDSGDEVVRLRTALETLAELVIAHGVMDARTLESIVGDLIRAPQAAVAAPLPPPAPSAAEATARGIPARAAAPAARPLVAAPKPIAARPAAQPVVAAPKPVVATRPVAAAPVEAPKPVVAAAPVAAPAPVVEAPKPVVAAAAVVEAPKPVVAAAPVVEARAINAPQAIAPEITVDETIVASIPAVAPVVAEPFPRAAAEPVRRKPNPFAPVAEPVTKPSQEVDTRRMPKVDAARLAAELTDLPAPAKKPSGFFGRLFAKKASPAAVAKAAASVEFTERMPKLPYELYGEAQKATELSFPPTPPPRRKTPVAVAPRKRSATPVRPANAGPTRFCDRCWRKLDGTGACKACSASA